MKYLALALVIVLTGCVKVSHNPDTGLVTYTRIGDQKLENVEIESSNGTKVNIGKQESEGLAEAIAAGVTRALK